MDIKSIEQELEIRVKAKLRSKPSIGLRNKLRKLQNNLSTTEGFVRDIVKILNDILEDRSISFDSEGEKQEFIELMKPKIIELIQKYILK